jgi:2-haloacid dehalogenase
VAYDVVGTVFSLERLRAPIAELGAPRDLLERWFVEGLRDYFAISHAGGYAPVLEVMGGALRRALEALGAETGAKAEAVLGFLSELDPVPDAEECCRLFDEAGWRQIALTNWSHELVRSLLDRAGLGEWVRTVRSCDEVGTSKPHPRVYEMALEEARGEEAWLLAAHAWDTQGAVRAGMRAALVVPNDGAYNRVLPAPDVQAPDLVAAARAILGRTG